MEQSIVTLEERLARAERRSRLALGMATVGLVGGLTLALANRAHTQTTGQEVTAPFRVRDGDGKLLCDVVSVAGSPSVRLYNSDGKVVFGASSTDGNGFVGLSDHKGQIEATVGSDGTVADGAQGGEVQLYGNNELAGEFAAAPDGGLLSVGKPGAKKWAAQLSEDDKGGLVFVRGKDGEPQVVLGAHPQGGGFVCVENAAGKKVAMMSAFGGGGTVFTTDHNGKALFSTPVSGEVAAASSPVSRSVSPPVADSGDTVESQIDGEFNGWDGDTIFRLTNGQVWQQASYSYHYHYAYRPKVIINRSGGMYKMEVAGVDDPVYVNRLK